MRFFRASATFAVLIVAIAAASTAQAQKILKNTDISLSGLYQTTQDTSGNGISDDPTHSGGGQVALRHSYHWWLGFEASYGYTRFAERYSNQPFPIQHNMHDFAASYLVSTPVGILGFRPFALAGVSAVVMSPSLNGGQNVSYQGRPGLNFAVGVNKAILTDHLGIRVQYRGLYYKTPDFGEEALTTNAWRLTSEPMIGAYVRF
jgi:Outer membrane protein beta-barrel domain